MCVAKIPIHANKPKDLNDTWKIPKQMLEAFENGQRPKMLVKCGKCYECKKERARNWTYKIWLEALNHKDKCFITLTYKETDNNLNKEHIQNFIKRLRKNYKLKNIKYFLAGEYGERKGRPHYHIILLGWKPPDMRLIRNTKSKKGYKMKSSKIITDTWGHGLTTVQDFAYKEVAYLTLYINHNEEINKYINKEQLKKRKEIKEQIEKDLGISTTNNNVRTGKLETKKLKALQDLKPEIYKEYKRRYNQEVNKIKLKKQPEFNLWSKGMGWETYIKKEYYKYDLIIDNFKYERPKEYLRKVYENMEQYEQEIIEHTIYNMLERKEYAEEQWEDTMSKSLLEQMREEKAQEEQNKNKIRMYKSTKSPF